MFSSRASTRNANGIATGKVVSGPAFRRSHRRTRFSQGTKTRGPAAREAGSVSSAAGPASGREQDGGSTGGSGGEGGAGSGNPSSGGDGGGDGHGDVPSSPRWRFLIGEALLWYVGALVAAAAAWDWVCDATSPLVDTTSATVSVIIPALNEERVIADTVRHVLRDLQPQPYEVIVVDGGSTDGTAEAARRAGARVLRSPGRGRGLQMNAGAEAAGGEVLLFLHADTQLPRDAVAEVRAALSAPRTVLVGFRPLIEDHGRPLWFSSLNNLTKTWYGPLIMRPASFVRGLRMMFGDQALSCRAADLRAAGGYRSDIPFMEDAELCIAMHMAGPADKTHHTGRGRLRMLLHRPAVTSGRRIAAWGELRANMVFAYVSLLWLGGAAPTELHSTYKKLYRDVR